MARTAEYEYHDDAFYFGCIGEAGHYLFNTLGRHVYREHLQKDFPLKSGFYGPNLDGVFCPNLPNEEQGVASLWHGSGWTILAFWDRSVDDRRACNSNFAMRGTLDFETAVAKAKERFPFVWSRFKFEVRPL